MTKEIIIIALVIALIYLYYKNKRTGFITLGEEDTNELFQVKEINQFLRDNLNSNNLLELKTKLGEKSLDELLEENEDYETEVDTLTRTKNSLEKDLETQATAFQSRLREKDREIKKFKEDLTSLEKRHQNSQRDLTSEKQQHKGSLARINKLTEQLTNLEQEQQKLKEQLKKMPGEFPEEDKTKEHQKQLREIYALFDLRARGMKEIDFNQLMNMLKGVKEKAGGK